MSSTTQPREDTRFLSIDGVRIETQHWLPVSDPTLTLVLMHEGLGSVSMWRNFPQRLAEATGCEVFAYSRQGYGRSDPFPLPRLLDYMEREATRVLPAVLEDAGIGRCILIGHSDGGSIAALHQTMNDDRIRGLVLMAPHFFVEDVSVESIEIARVAWQETDLPDRLGKYHDNPANAFKGWSDAWLDPEFRSWDITACIRAFSVPCLAIQGKHDAYGTAAQIEILPRLSNASVDVHVLDECEHAPHKHQPDKTLALITEFVKRISVEEGSA